LTSSKGRIVGGGVDPCATDDPDHLRYHARNRAAGRCGGELRIRLRHRRLAGPWFAYWLMSPQELEHTLPGTGWRLDEVQRDQQGGYMAVLEKD
jgi:hypothetical protein